MTVATICRSALLVMAVAMGMTRAAGAQSLEVHGFFDVGATLFTASESFKAVTGSSSGFVIGGGGGVTLPQKIFIDVRASRFKKDGQRVVVFNGDVLDLGIDNTITITPLEVTGGYRFGRTPDSVRPYAGGGISWYRYQETDAFAASDAVDERFTGFHLLGGAEFRLAKWLAAAGEVQWTTVPNALGQDPTSVGAVFDESNLGGTTFRAKVVIGR